MIYVVLPCSLCLKMLSYWNIPCFWDENVINSTHNRKELLVIGELLIIITGDVAFLPMREKLIKYRIRFVHLLLSFCFVSNAAWAATVEQLHSQAIQLAKQGKVQESYHELVLLHGRYPDNLPVLYDLVELAARAGQPQQSFKYGQSIPNAAEAPTYVLEYMGKVTRNVGKYALSYRYYQMLYAREAKADYLLGSVLATTLSKQYKLAKQSLATLMRTFPGSIEYYQAKGFLETQQKIYSGAINTYTRGLEKYPEHPELLRGLVAAYRKLNAASLAEKIVKKYPKVFAKRLANDIAGDLLANRIRLAGTTKFNIIDETEEQLETIALLEARIAASDGSDVRTKFDLIVAYIKLGKAAEAIELYESLLAEKIPVPAYVEAEIGKAYLDLREPEKTIAIYERIFPKKIPFKNKQVLFYAYTESRQFDQAERLLQRMRKENPTYLGKKSLKIPEPNPNRVDVELRDVSMKLAKGDLAAAYDKVKALSDEAPANAKVRAAQAVVEARRGWHEQAAVNYGIATNLDPNRLATMVESIDNDMYLGRYKAAGEKLRLLIKLRPYDRSVQRAKDRWEQHTGWQLSGSGKFSNNKNSAVDGEEVHYTTTLKAPLINDSIRPFISHSGYQSQLPDQSLSVGRNIAGIELESYKTDLTLALGQGDNGELAADAGIEYRIDDQWQTGLAYQKNSIMPAKAAKDNISGDKLSGFITYRTDETFNASVGASLSDYSDDNQRLAVFSAAEKQLYQSPDYTARAGVRADYSHNKAIASANYYNPKSAASLLFSLDNNWLNYARYDYRFSQNLSLGAGLSYEEDYGSNFVGRIGYGHNWQFNQDVALFYQAVLESRAYDGKRENNANFTLGFNWHLH